MSAKDPTSEFALVKASARPVPSPEGSVLPPAFPFCRYLCLAAVMLTSCLSISFLWPFVGFMVIEFELTQDRNEVGYYTGLMLSMFFLGRAVSSPLWGYIADTYGRKIVIYISLLGSGALMLLFGLVDNFRDALILRFLGGFMNSLLSICRAMASEMCHSSHHARAVTFPSVAWQVGLVIGPAIGGLFAEPCSKESEIGASLLKMLGSDSNSIFCERPFLLSCTAGAFLHVLVLPCALLLPETGPTSQCSCRSRFSYTSVDTLGNHISPQQIGTSTATSHKEQVRLHKEDRQDEELPAVISTSENPLKGLSSPTHQEHLCVLTKQKDVSVDVSEECQALGGKQVAGKRFSRERWITKTTLCLIAMNCGLVGGSNLTDNAISIWCMADMERGGLAWPVERIGEAYIFVGILSLLSQLLATPAIIRMLGAQRAMYISTGLLVPIHILLPQLGIISTWVSNEVTIFAVFVLLMWLRQAWGSVAHAGLQMIINDSVSAKVRCQLQGTITSVQSAMQSGIPMASGSLFAWSLDALPSPYGSEFVFLLTAFLWSGNCFAALNLPQASRKRVLAQKSCTDHQPP